MNRNDTVEELRDERLGELLRELDVPEHRPHFNAELRRRLHEERLANRRRTVSRWGLRVAAVAVVAAVAFVFVGLPRGGKAPSLGPQAAGAAVVKAHVRAALASLQSISGVLVASGPRENGGTWRFDLDATGSLRLEGPQAGDVMTYDADTGVVRSAQHSASLGGDAIFYAERAGVAPGAPDQGPPDWVLPEQYGAFVRAALVDTPSSVSSTSYDGRPAWLLEVATTPNLIVPALSGDHLSITVDRRTGMPVRVVESKNGSVLRELRIENLVVDPPLPASTFALAFPAGAEVTHSNDGFRRVTLDQVAAAVGYHPLVPSWVPDGYRLSEVDVADEAAPTGRAGNPASRQVVSLSYRRGIDQVVVTTRLRGSSDWTDPLASPEGYTDSAVATPLTSGALAGVESSVVLATRTTPHLWALTGSLVVTIDGSLDRAELTRMANSLTQR
jgi:hypothetical protein